MQSTTWTILAVLLSAACTVAAAQRPYELQLDLPPEVMLDKYRAQIERRFAFAQYESALMFMDDVIALHRDSGWPVPVDIHFEYARAAVLAIEKELDWRGGIDPRDRRRLTETAVGALHRYLTSAGPSGEHYTEALVMLDELELDTPWRRR